MKPPATSAASKDPEEKAPKVAAEELLKDCSRFGNLTKQGGIHKNWRKRLCILHQGMLYYFKSKKDKEPKGAISVLGLWVDHADKETGKNNCLKIITPTRTYYAISDSPNELEKWIESLRSESAKQKERDIVVDPQGFAQFTKISEAASFAEDGDTIHLRAGDYNESIRIEKNVSVLGLNTEQIDVTVTSEDRPPFSFKAEKGTLSNVILRQKSRDGVDCVEIHSGKFHITNCMVSSEGGTGIAVWQDADCTIKDCVVSDCRCNGISFSDSSSGTILDSCVQNSGWDGIRIQANADAMIERNKVLNGKGYGIHHDSAQSVKIHNNELTGNMKDGIKVEEDCEADTQNNTTN